MTVSFYFKYYYINSTPMRRLQFLIALFFSAFFFSTVKAQNTVGLISHITDESYSGYNLFYSHNQEKTLLIDNEGQVVHYWDDNNDYRPGNSVYLLANGDLVRCKRPSNRSEDAIWAGGGGAIVEIVDWEGNAKAFYELNNENARLHHDVVPMENGNILMIAWSKVDSTTAANAGRDPQIITQSQVWSEKILEWDPVADEIVWEWDAFDHIIQDRFPERDNYGIINDNKQKIDVNYDEHDGHPDWLHINSIDYNETLDQIVLSVPYFNEFWIIDHSISTNEASGDAGDLVYRWGNPATYQSSTAVGQSLFFQHDVNWVNANAQLGDEDYGQILLFNNRLPNQTSVAQLIATIDPNTGEYFVDEIASEQALIETYAHPQTPDIAYSTGLSSAQRLPNGNHLILSGRYGYAYELNQIGELVWEYRIPLLGGELVPQGTELSVNDNITFRMKRFPLDYAAFEGRDLSQKGLLEEFIFENDENDGEDVVTSVEREDFSQELTIQPNPAIDEYFIGIPVTFVNKDAELKIISIATGKLISNSKFEQLPQRVSMNGGQMTPGIYLVIVENENGYAIKKLLISK